MDSRRNFLKKTVLLGMAGTEATQDSRLDTDEAIHQYFLDPKIPEINREEGEIKAIPEYRRNLKEVFIIGSTDLFNVRSVDSRNANGAEINYSALFNAMPEYTKIVVAVEKREAKEVEAILRSLGIKQTLEIRVVPNGFVNLDYWAQDYFEPIQQDGKSVILVPKYYPAQKNIAHTRRSAMVKEAFGVGAVKNAGFYFQGGDICFDEVKGVTTMFIGNGTVGENVRLYNESFGERPISQPQMVKRIKKGVGGLPIMVMGEYPSSSRFFHLDDSFVILDGQRVVIHEVDMRTEIDIPDLQNTIEPRYFKTHKMQGSFENEAENVAEDLKYYERQFNKLGYNISKVSISKTDSLALRTSMNAVPFVDAETGQKKIIFPVYRREIVRQHDFTKVVPYSALGGKAKTAYGVFKDLGYEPSPVENFTYTKNGQDHCLVNVLS